LVEFAILAPLLILLLFGIVEFGYTMGQLNDVRHGAREAARLAAVNAGTVNAMATTACNSMSISGGVFTFTDGGTTGNEAAVNLTASRISLTGLPFISSFLPTTLTDTVTIRLEQDSTNWNSGVAPACP
jgi:Flp pilus assembly protein TadG